MKSHAGDSFIEVVFHLFISLIIGFYITPKEGKSLKKFIVIFFDMRQDLFDLFKRFKAIIIIGYRINSLLSKEHGV